MKTYEQARLDGVNRLKHEVVQPCSFFVQGLRQDVGVEFPCYITPADGGEPLEVCREWLVSPNGAHLLEQAGATVNDWCGVYVWSSTTSESWEKDDFVELVGRL